MINIREANVDDWQGIRALISLHKMELAQSRLTSYRSFFVAEFSSDTDKQAPKRLVGCCALSVLLMQDLAEDEPPASAKEAEIRSLAVLDEFRGLGVGAKLVDKCVERACKLGINQIICFTSSPDFFRPFGFHTEHGSKWVMFKQYAIHTPPAE